MALTAKQEQFCKEYIIDLNATQAAIRSGYSVKTAGQIGEQNLRKLEIASHIKVLMDKRSERTEISADWVLKTIRDTVERCSQAVAVVIDGQPTGEYKFEHTGVLKGCELLGRHLKLFTDKTEVSGPNGGPQEFKDLTPEEAYKEALKHK